MPLQRSLSPPRALPASMRDTLSPFRCMSPQSASRPRSPLSPTGSFSPSHADSNSFRMRRSLSTESFGNYSFALVDANPHCYYTVPDAQVGGSMRDWKQSFQLWLVCICTLLFASLTVLGSWMLLQGVGLPSQSTTRPIHTTSTTVVGDPFLHKPDIPLTANAAMPAGTTESHLEYSDESDQFTQVGAAAMTLHGHTIQLKVPLKRSSNHFSKAAARSAAVAAIGVPSVALMGNVFANLEGPLMVDFLGGLVAAFCAVCIMYPVDHIKTRIQLGQPIIPAGGIGHLYNGIAYAFAKDCPAAAVYITTFELIKSSLLSVSNDHTSALGLFLLLAVAGSIGDFCGSIFALPMELVLKPIQAGQKVSFTQVFKSHGLSGILGCWKSVLMRDMPMGALQLAFFESLKPFAPLVDDQYHLPHFGTMMLIGAIAGAASAFLTTPCDLLTSRVMTSTEHKTKVCVFELAKDIYEKEGIRGLFRGATMRAYYFAPEACIFFGIFETITTMFNN